MSVGSRLPVSRAVLKARDLEAVLEQAVRRLETAQELAELREAEELAAKAAQLAAELSHAVSLFSGMVKSEVAVRRGNTRW